MKGIESELLWQILHTGRKEVNVEAVRLRNQILLLHNTTFAQCIAHDSEMSVSVRAACFICIVL